jgi:hypothetical protein
MTLFSEQLSSVRKSQWDAQLDVFRALSARALDSTQQVIALNITTSRGALEQATSTFKQLLDVRAPRDLFALGSAAQNPWQQWFAYSRELAGIATGGGLRPWNGQPLAAPAAAAAPAALVAASTPPAGEPTELEAEKTKEAPSEQPDGEPASNPADMAAADGAPTADPQAAAADPIDAIIAAEAPPATQKALVSAMNRAAPKPLAAEHPIAAPLPHESAGPIALPVVTPVESAAPLHIQAQGGKPARVSRKK